MQWYGLHWEPWFRMLVRISIDSDFNGFKTVLNNLIHWLEAWNRIEQAMLPFLLPGQIQYLITEPEDYSLKLLQSLRKDFDSIVDMDRLWKEMSVAEQSVTKSVEEESRKLKLSTSSEVIGLFENSIKLAWIEHIENRNILYLRSVTSLKMKQWEEQLQQSILVKQKLSSDITGIKLREATYQDIEKNRLGNRVTYRELGHQVTKSVRSGRSGSYWKITPRKCFLWSRVGWLPRTRSAIFPMQKPDFSTS